MDEEEGAQYLGEGKVKTPTGFKEVFQSYAESGWVGLGGGPEYGGQGMPKWSPCLPKRWDDGQPIYSSASWTWRAVQVSTNPAVLRKRQKQTYLEKIYSVSGQVPCLTELACRYRLGYQC